MEKNILHKFYKGLASAKEKEAIKKWLESNPRHEKEFLNEREFLNATIFSVKHPDYKAPKAAEKKIHPLRRLYIEVGKVAVVVALTFAGGSYFYMEKMKEITSAVHTVSVPPGQRVQILLPDSTRVWLNARSEIKYPAFFGAEREVELNGEAYFEVSHNENAPFIVHTDKYDVEVLGTTFNVDAYRNNDNFSVALIEGSVKVINHEDPENTVTLSPHYRADYANGVVYTRMIDDYDTYRWREGLLCFKDMSFIDLLHRLEKCYDIRIVIENNRLPNYTISGKLRISDGIDNALRILQKDARYTYLRDSEMDVIYIK
jgi:ferric-dicitrate binding protein FerR (iron transport regulator)